MFEQTWRSADDVAEESGRSYSVEGDHKPFVFSGGSFEYFGIWISNLFLTILTVGIYSAWAKVRRLRYFYGNTTVADHSFDFHGSPIAILKGRLIAVAFFIVYNISITVFPSSILIFLLLFIFLFPWVIKQSLRFNARMTSYRNVRFDFHGSYLGALYALILWPIIGFLSLFTLMPFATRATQNYLARNFSYGGRPFKGKLPIGKIYGYFFKTILIGFALAAIGSAIVYLAFSGVEIPPEALQIEGEEAPPLPVDLGILIAVYGGMLFAFVVAPTYYSTLVHNLLYNSVVLDEQHGFDSRLNPWRMVWIVLSNLIAVAATLGLLYPWTQIRLARYKAKNTSLITSGDLDKYTSQLEADSATGDAFGDVLDFDIAF